MINVIIASLACYLLGSLNTAIIVGRLRGVAIREIGTRNAGASNVWRSIGKTEGFIVGATDVAKGIAAAWWGTSLGMPLLPSLAVVAGHNWPIFFRFRGGKGLAAAMGAASWLSPLAIAVGIVPLIAFSAYRFSGAGPFFIFAFSAATGWVIHPGAAGANLAMAVLVYARRVQTAWQELLQGPNRLHLLWDLFLYDRLVHPKESFWEVVFG